MESQSGHSPDRHESEEFQMSVESSGENGVQDSDKEGRGRRRRRGRGRGRSRGRAGASGGDDEVQNISHGRGHRRGRGQAGASGGDEAPPEDRGHGRGRGRNQLVAADGAAQNQVDHEEQIVVRYAGVKTMSYKVLISSI